MLRWRLFLGALLIGAVAGLGWLDGDTSYPGLWLLPLVIVISVLGTRELLDLLAAAGMRPLPWVVQLLNIALAASPWVQRPALTVAVPIFLLLCAEMSRYCRPGGNTANIAGGVFALFYIGLMLQFAVALRLSWGLAALASWIIAAKLGDTGAYIFGRLLGRHKMSPLISPGKTIEGAIGGLACSCAGSALTFWLMRPQSSLADSWLEWTAFGLLVGAAGMMGDLVESLLKRDVGVKDSSTWLPGFGGVLDIVDSLLLSAPVAWFCWASGLVGR